MRAFSIHLLPSKMQQELSSRHCQPVWLVEIRMDDRIRDTRFVFITKKDETARRARVLTGNHGSGNPDLPWIPAA